MLMLVPAGAMPLHCESLFLLADSLDILKLGDQADGYVDELETCQLKHHTVFRECYGDAYSKQKIHYKWHIANNLRKKQNKSELLGTRVETQDYKTTYQSCDKRNRRDICSQARLAQTYTGTHVGELTRESVCPKTKASTPFENCDGGNFAEPWQRLGVAVSCHPLGHGSSWHIGALCPLRNQNGWRGH